MRYADWTDREWNELLTRVRAYAPTSLSDSEIRQAAWNYMHNGADGGHNQWGLEGTAVAMCADKVG